MNTANPAEDVAALLNHILPKEDGRCKVQVVHERGLFEKQEYN
jgi:hypothetical protein